MGYDPSLSHWAWSIIVALAVVFCLLAHRAKRRMDIALVRARIKHLEELITDCQTKELYHDATRLMERRIDQQIELIRLTGGLPNE